MRDQGVVRIPGWKDTKAGHVHGVGNEADADAAPHGGFHVYEFWESQAPERRQ